jgi:hypothetical protein
VPISEAALADAAETVEEEETAAVVAVVVVADTDTDKPRDRSGKRKTSSICPSMWTRTSRSSLVVGVKVCVIF